MDVFVESNFVLELAFQQEHYEACERIVAGAAARAYSLHVPQYALSEVFHTLHQRSRERGKNQEYFRKEIEQHRREAEADTADTDQLVRLLADLLTARTKAQTARLFAITARLANEASGPSLTASVLLEAQTVREQHGLFSQDALIYASVLAGLRLLPSDTPKLFITRNKNDFERPAIVQKLQDYNCRLMSNFTGAADFLDSITTAPPEASSPDSPAIT